MATGVGGTLQMKMTEDDTWKVKYDTSLSPSTLKREEADHVGPNREQGLAGWDMGEAHVTLHSELGLWFQLLLLVL